MALDDASSRERRLDHAPEPLVGRIVRIPDRRPIHHLVQPSDHQAFGHESLLFGVSEVAAAPFIGGRRNR
jgi:hypothetical protein